MEHSSSVTQIVSEVLSAKGRPCIVGIGGGAGVGKTTFADSLKSALEDKGKTVFVIHLDDFFKSPEERKLTGTEWDENHINLAEARRVLESIKRGAAKITKPKYNRTFRKIEPEIIDISGIDVAIFEGIYAIASDERLGNFLEFIGLPVFMSAEISDIKKWRFLQEEKKPYPRSREQMERHWNLGILPDLRNNILPSKKNARFIVSVDSSHEFSIAQHI